MLTLFWLLLYAFILHTSVRKEFVILKSIGIIAMKSRETRSVIYTCRYSSGHFAVMSTGISAGVDDWPCLSTFYCYDPYWLQIFPYTCLFTFFVPIIILVNSHAPLQIKEWSRISFSCVPHPLKSSYASKLCICVCLPCCTVL